VTSGTRIQGVSAIVCNFNGEEYLEDCLRAIQAQAGVDELLVVDDASTDGSVALMRERFPAVRVIELERNSGPCVARNVGMRAAKQRWILAVDNDAVLRPDVVTKLRAALEEHPEFALAQPRSVMHDDPERIHYDSGSFHYVGLLALRNFYTRVAEAEGEGVVEVDALIGICALMDREVVLTSGGYDEAFFYLSEDYELAYRLRMQGVRILAVEDAIVLHRGGTAGLSFRGGGYPERRAFLHSRNRWRILLKCYATRTLIVAAPGILVYELVWLLFMIKSRHFLSYLAGKRAFFGQLGDTLTKRAVLQSRRTVPDRKLLVGGPLTLSPSLVESPAAAFASRALDRVLRAWWFLVRWLAG
jgi:GT2 family glycosyltransferase